MKTELEQVIKELLQLGEDQDELFYWRDIFDDLDEANKKKILDNLKNELQRLSAIR